MASLFANSLSIVREAMGQALPVLGPETRIEAVLRRQRREADEPERKRRYIDAIAETADRAAKLTSQLLAFARRQALKPEVFRRLYTDFAAQNPKWNEIPSTTGNVYSFDETSTYIQEPPFFTNSRFTVSFSPSSPRKKCCTERSRRWYSSTQRAGRPSRPARPDSW